jgi:hypothetical protein
MTMIPMLSMKAVTLAATLVAQSPASCSQPSEKLKELVREDVHSQGYQCHDVTYACMSVDGTTIQVTCDGRSYILTGPGGIGGRN